MCTHPRGQCWPAGTLSKPVRTRCTRLDN
jgi:hypothetical protein